MLIRRLAFKTPINLMRIHMRRLWWGALGLLLCAALAACRQSAQPTPMPDTPLESESLDIEMAVEPSALAVGEAVLVISLHTPSGEPIGDARIEAHGDMTHAGMVPVLGETEGGDAKGVYRIPFEWTMAGDWIVTLVIALPDGSQITRTFEMVVET